MEKKKEGQREVKGQREEDGQRQGEEEGAGARMDGWTDNWIGEP